MSLRPFEQCSPRISSFCSLYCVSFARFLRSTSQEMTMCVLRIQPSCPPQIIHTYLVGSVRNLGPVPATSRLKIAQILGPKLVRRDTQRRSKLSETLGILLYIRQRYGYFPSCLPYHRFRSGRSAIYRSGQRKLFRQSTVLILTPGRYATRMITPRFLGQNSRTVLLWRAISRHVRQLERSSRLGRFIVSS